jgi:hypothetical protein
MLRALLAVPLVLAFSLIGGLASLEAAPTDQLLGMVGTSGSQRLARVDPVTLRPLPGKGIDVGSGGCASREGGEACWTTPPWSFSPDGARLAVARNGRFELGSLRIVAVDHLRVEADIRLDGGPIGYVAWLAPGRLLVLQEICCGERQRLLAVDLASGRVTASRELGGSVLGVDRAGDDLVMLIGPAQSIGPARLAVADSSGGVRFVGLDRIAAGIHLESMSPHEVKRQLPGLAVDAGGGRVFVVAKDVVAEVDLASLAVSYHALARRAPASLTKASHGYLRWSRRLGNGVIAVTGSDDERPAGLLLVDTSTWSVRTLDGGAWSFTVAGDAVLATGPSIGIRAYGFDGRRRFHLFDGRQVWVAQVYGDRAFVGISGRDEPLRIVDVVAGRVVGTREAPLPWLVQGRTSGWWGVT